MELKVKLVSGADGFVYLIIIAQGIIDSRALEEVFQEVVRNSRLAPNCRVLIDLDDASFAAPPDDIEALASRLAPTLEPNSIKIALASSELGSYDRLRLIHESLSGRNVRIALFRDNETALAWLSEPE